MPSKLANSSSLNDSSRCRHRTPNGRCCMSAVDPTGTLCFDHARLAQKGRDAANLAAALAGELTEFKSAVQINDFLSRLLLLLAQNRISPRRAAVLAYITNQLLRTLSAIDRENNPPFGPDGESAICPSIEIDLPRPNREHLDHSQN
ncbi:MAG: hypothetical protein LAN84_13465 [Acidobacteriia bacterium]|nr:hypothetical protein [Terriglobia bacterium]